MFLLAFPVWTCAETNTVAALFEVSAAIRELASMGVSDGSDDEATVVSPGTPAVAEEAGPATTAAADEALNATFRYRAAAEQYWRNPSMLRRDSMTAPARLTLAGWIKSIPLNVLQTFNILDPIPIELGPPPSALPLEEQPRVKSLSDPYESPLILFGGRG